MSQLVAQLKANPTQQGGNLSTQQDWATQGNVEGMRGMSCSATSPATIPA